MNLRKLEVLQILLKEWREEFALTDSHLKTIDELVIWIRNQVIVKQERKKIQNKKRNF